MSKTNLSTQLLRLWLIVALAASLAPATASRATDGTVGIPSPGVQETRAPSAPSISATKTDALLIDNDGDGVADPGDTLRYTVVISNSGDMDATNVVFSDTIDAHTTISGTLRASPVAVMDVFAVASGSTTSANVLSNDYAGQPSASVSSFGGPGAGNAGDVPADGTTTYTAPSGIIYTLASDGTLNMDASGLAPGTSGTDEVYYTLSNGAFTDIGQVSITYGDAPVPQGDAYTFSFNVDQNVAAGAGLFVDNGSGADNLGTPAGSLDFFGGGSLGGSVTDNPAGSSVALAGGSLTVNADGSWSLMGQPFIPGQYTFAYRVSNSVGADTATVTFDIQQPPAALDDDPLGVPAYTVAAGSTLIVPDGPADVVERNDDVGFPAATLISFGGGSLGGAVTDNIAGASVACGGACILTVNADGSLSLVTDAAQSGTFTFDYRLANALGTSDAQVTVGIRSAPMAVDDTVAPGSSPGDTYHTPLNTTLNVPDGPSDLLANDFLGLPLATLTSFGGGDLGGAVTDNAAGNTANFGAGSLTVDASGSFTFTPDTNFTGLFSFDYRIQNALGSDDGTVTLAVGVRPVAGADGRTATGNVQIDTSTIPFSVLDNDAGDQLAITGMDTNSANSGAVAHLGAGQFTYNPLPGFEGTDTFDYQAANGFGTVTGTVTITVSNMIWFIDNDPGAPPGNDGRLTSPFTTLASLEAVNGGGGANDPESGDNIFIYETGSGDYIGGLTLENNQRLIGQGASGTLAALTGITLAPGSLPLPLLNGINPVLANLFGNGLTLASGNEIRGLTVEVANGFAITDGGASVGGLTIAEAAINNTTGGGLNIANGGTLNVTLDGLVSNGGTNGVNLVNVGGTFVANGGNIQSPTGTAFNVNGGNAAVTYNGGITQNTAGRVVEIQNTTGGSVTFQSGTVTGGASSLGVRINAANGNVSFADLNLGTSGGRMTNTALTLAGSSSGTFSFADLQIFTAGATGISANNGGTIQITGAGNTVDATNGVAVNLTNTTIGASGVTFLSVNASNADTGITLNNTGSGNFSVTGSGTTDGSGGTLGNLNDHGIELINAQDVSISNMNLTNAATTQEVASNAPTCTNLSSGTNTGCNAPVHMVNASNVSLTNLTINGSVQHGVNGNNVNGLSISNTDVSNIGNQNNENGMHFINLLGTVSLSNVSVVGSDTRNVLIENNSGTANVSVTNSTFNTAGRQVGLDFLGLGTANITFSVTDSSFTHNNSVQLKALADDNSRIDATITGNDFDGDPAVSGNSGIDLAVVDGGTLTFDVIGTLVNPQTFQPFRSHAINVFASGGGTASGRVNGNTIIGSAFGSGVRAVAQVTDVNGFNPSITIEIKDNTINDIGGAGSGGIYIESRDGSGGLTGTANVQATLDNNDVTINGADSVIQARANSGNTLCLDVTNNTAAGAATSPFAPFGSTHYIGNPVIGDTSGPGNVTYDGYISGNLGGTWNANGNSPTLAAGIGGEAFVDGTEPTNGTCTTVALLQTTDNGIMLAQTDAASLPPQDSVPGAAEGETRPYPASAGVLLSQENVNVAVGTLPPGKAITLTFEVTINDPLPAEVFQVSNQGRVSGDNFAEVLTDDPDSAAVGDPTVTPVEPSPSINRVYLPFVANNLVQAPDLIVAEMTATRDNIQLVIQNDGNAPVSGGFWVDVYIDPDPVPTAVNQIWPDLADQGLVWGITVDALPALVPGGVLTLTVSDPYYRADLSQITWPLSAGTPVYAQVDSANADTSYGGVLESHEISGGAYNNISSVTSTLNNLALLPLLAADETRPALRGDLPARP